MSAPMRMLAGRRLSIGWLPRNGPDVVIHLVTPFERKSPPPGGRGTPSREALRASYGSANTTTELCPRTALGMAPLVTARGPPVTDWPSPVLTRMYCLPFTE